MTDETVIAEKVREWARRVGFSMEIRVVKKFIDAGFTNLSPSTYFEDPIERGKFREIDLAAHEWLFSSDKTMAATCAIFVECKYAKMPWVVFTHRYADDEETAKQGVLSRITNSVGRQFLLSISDLADAYNLPLFGVADRLGTNVTQPNEKWQSTSSDPNNAIEQVLTAARAEAAISSDPSKRPYLDCEVIFPLVVVGGDLYECYLDDDGNPQQEKIEWAQVIRSVIDAPSPILIDVVTESFLSEWLDEAADSMKTLTKLQMGFLTELRERKPNA